MENKNLKPTQAQDYKKKIAEGKLITLPSGSVFKIRKVNNRELALAGEFTLQTSSEINQSKEKLSTQWQNMNEQQKRKQLEVMNKFIVRAVVEPKVVLDDKEEGLKITDIVDDDFYFLLSEVMGYSYEGGKDLVPFRKKQNTPAPGSDEHEVSSTTT